jgi:hypothetical protein
MDMLKAFVSELAGDGYSKYFAIVVVISFIPLIIDIAINGWNLEEESE